MQDQDNNTAHRAAEDEGFGNFGVRAGAQFQFTVNNNTVTAVSEVIGSRTLSLHIPSDATFTVGSGTIAETLTGEHRTTMLTFQTDAANSSLYDLTSIAETINTPTTTTHDGDTAGYSFTIAKGVVTGEQFTVTHDGHTSTHTLTPPPDASFTVGKGSVTETLVEGHTVETIQFVQPSGSTLYALASETKTFVLPGSATTLLNVEPFERMQFTLGSGATVTGVATVSSDGTATTITPNSHTTFTQLAPGFVEEVRTHGTHSSYEVFYAGSGANGTYTAIAEGSGTTVDLVGLQHQLAQLPAATAALI